MSDVRNAYITKFQKLSSPTNMEERIKTLQTTPNDEKIVMAVVTHYNGWTQDRLLKNLTTGNWFKYQIFNSHCNRNK